jgi:uncharacterized membrane protein YidH (DUF202 family)
VWKWVELRLENSGSVARDHLASERTFLAYVRTSLALASSGLGESPLFSFRAYGGLTFQFYVITALVQLFSTASATSRQEFHFYIRLLGASIVIAGLLVLFIGLSSNPRETTLISFIYFSFCSGSTRYFTTQVALTKGVFPVARLAAGFISMMLGVLVTLTFGILLAASGKLEQK